MAGEITTKDRAKAAVLGAFVADAATMGVHWIYDQGKLATLLEDKGQTAHPEFFDPPSCPFYQASAGSLSPYGYELLPLVKFLVEQKGALEGPAWTAYLVEFYRTHMGYKNKTAKNMVINADAGKQYPETGDPADKEANMLVKAIAVAAVYAGKPELAAVTEVAVRAQQNSDAAVAFGVAAALLLERVILGSTVGEALEWAFTSDAIAADVKTALQTAVGMKAQPFNEVVTKLGASCSNPGAIQNAAVAAAVSVSFVAGVRANAKAGGDNCSRSMLVGALLAAEYGPRSIPTEWTDKTTLFDELDELTDELVALRTD